ncbi:MAG: hypothetical protein M1819_006329 [Sarea resinae]|nr:MAG: hypothetical protein M1819_006329 [Sarea resinae]
MGKVKNNIDPEELARASRLMKTPNEFIQNLPKVELHLHIEGTLSPALRWRLAQRNHLQLKHKSRVYETEEQLASSYNVIYNHRGKLRGDDERPTFLDAYYGGMDVLREPEDFYDLGMAYLERCRDMSVRYTEPFFDPQAHTRRGVSLEAVMDGLKRAQTDGKGKLGVSSQWTMCFLRDMSPESAMEHYTAALAYRPFVHAIGLDSDEYDRPPSLFEDVYQRARADGFRLTCHCDVAQKDTHDHIRQVASTVAGTGADRIDHGLNAADDPDLVALVQERDLGMTICPWAYYRHEPADEVFPKVRMLFDAGVKVTINSDDPAYMGDNWVVENLALVEKMCGFSRAELCQLERNAIEISWAPELLKARLLDELENFQRVFK